MSKKTARIFYAVVTVAALGLAVFGIVMTIMGNRMGILGIVLGVVLAIASRQEAHEKMKEAEMREFYREQMFNKCVEAIRNPLRQLGFSDELLELAKKHGALRLDLDIGRGMFVELNKIPKETREEMMKNMDEQVKNHLRRHPVLFYPLSSLFPDEKQK
jgi:hypothetical protein